MAEIINEVVQWAVIVLIAGWNVSQGGLINLLLKQEFKRLEIGK